MRMRRIESGLVTGLCLAAVLAGCGGDNNTIAGGMNPPPGMTTPGDLFGLSSTGRLLTFNRAAPALATGVAITGLATGETLLGIDVRPGGTTPGELYALGSTGKLYTVNKTTGVATLKSTLSADATDTTAPFTALSGTDFGVDFNPTVDRLRIISDTGQNLRVNVDTGATITDGGLNTATVARMGVTDTAYTNDFAATCRTTLFFIDPNTDKLLTTADPNAGTVTEVGALGVDAAAAGGFDIITGTDGTNTAFAVLNVGGISTVYSINLSTGAATSTGAVTGLNSGELVRGLAANTQTSGPANALGTVVGLTETNKLISFLPGAPQKLCTTVAVTGLSGSEKILGIDTRPADGMLYAATDGGRLYTLNTSTGAATLKSTLAPAAGDAFTALSGTEFGVDFNPVPDRLRLVSDTGQNLRVNVDTGAVITDTALSPVGSTAVSAAYTNSFAGTGTTTLYVLDSTGDRLEIQGAPPSNPNLGILTPVGSGLGIGDVQAIAGFDIAGTNNAAIAAVNLAGATTSDFETIDLVKGTATRVNTIGGGERVRGLAMVAAPVATVFAADVNNNLVSFKVTTPGTLDTTVPITGLQGGDSVLGMDFRPANGKLYALTTGAKIYTIVPATGVATLVSSLAADATDTTNPFTTLGTGASGVNFNPVADRLRVVSSTTGQNLRINVDTGFVTTDGTLNPGTPSVVAVAYTQSYSPTPAATKLFDIDLSTASLLLQTPPNDGVLVPVGLLDTSLTPAAFTNVAGFDIAGGDDGLSLGALQPTTATQSNLYRVNLAPITPAGGTAPSIVTSLGAIGPAGTLIKALAIQLK
ncbi:MAG: DUF4394 domain-containing protein [Gammaproteobacteria bacterium]